jgi:pimeloyl-ACP methyl ester carboxylesterase
MAKFIREHIMHPQTQYAKTGDINIAYQVHGDGPIDIVYVPGWISHLEVGLQNPAYSHMCKRLSAFARLIVFDKRGTGLSDWAVGFPTLEQRMDDVRAVMDAVGSERAAIFGHSTGGNMCMLFAATYPERTSALVLFNTFAKRLWGPDYPWAPTPEDRDAWVTNLEREWREGMDLSQFAPSRAGDQAFADWLTAYYRNSASPGTAMMLARLNSEIDVRSILPTIQVPTLILHRVGDRTIKVEEAQFLAEQIAKAKFVKLPGADHILFAGDADAFIDEIQEFLTGIRRGPDPDRILLTLLFTDIVGSTKLAAKLGDQTWKNLLDQHDERLRLLLAHYRGVEVNTTGDGFLAAFDGPARAVECAMAIHDDVGRLDLGIRAGIHTSECERRGDDVSGIAVHLASRILNLAGDGEILVSRTVKDLAVGSGINFSHRQDAQLKGIPGTWPLFAATSSHPSFSGAPT